MNGGGAIVEIGCVTSGSVGFNSPNWENFFGGCFQFSPDQIGVISNWYWGYGFFVILLYSSVFMQISDPLQKSQLLDPKVSPIRPIHSVFVVNWV